MGALESRKATPPTPPSPPANNPIETESETWSTTDPLDSIILHTSEEAKARGGAAWKAGDVDGAIRWFSEAIDLDADNDSGQLHVHYSNRSAAYLKQDKAAAALSDAEKCVSVEPSWAKGYSRMGTALFRLGRHAQAAAAYSKGLEREPGSVELRKNLLEAQKQHHASQASASRAARPRETLSQYVKGHVSLTVQFALRAFLLASWVIYVLPLQEASLVAYKRCLYAMVLVSALGLHGRHGRVRLNMEYAAAVSTDPSCQTIMTALLFIANRPYLVGIVPMVLLELTDFLWFLSGLLQMSPGIFFEKLDRGIDKFGGAVFGIPNWSSRSVTDRWSAAKSKASEWSAWVEVMFGMILVAELLLPRRNFVMLALYWQTLRMKYMLNTTTGRGYTKAAFRTLDARIKVVTTKRRCPPIVGTLYAKLKTFLATLVMPPPHPSAAGAAPGRPSCSVM
eukprot:jgi/Undpi1/8574/HiC_scaffold_25.g11039.m1